MTSRSKDAYSVPGGSIVAGWRRVLASVMSTTEWILVVLVILIPAVIATAVTLWTLEQARLRSRKNRRPSGAAAKREQPLDPANR